jgi:hypothetical protein
MGPIFTSFPFSARHPKPPILAGFSIAPLEKNRVFIGKPKQDTLENKTNPADYDELSISIL